MEPKQPKPEDQADNADNSGGSAPAASQPEVGGRGGLDPTRYGDWEIGGRCVDF